MHTDSNLLNDLKLGINSLYDIDPYAMHVLSVTVDLKMKMKNVAKA